MAKIEDAAKPAFEFMKSNDRIQKTGWIMAIIIFFGWANYFLASIHLRDDDRREQAWQQRDSLHLANEKFWQGKYEAKDDAYNNLLIESTSVNDTLKKVNYELINEILKKK